MPFIVLFMSISRFLKILLIVRFGIIGKQNTLTFFFLEFFFLRDTLRNKVINTPNLIHNIIGSFDMGKLNRKGIKCMMNNEYVKKDNAMGS
ncbi:Uncharacterized protein TCM_012493 [Theobroma cacao]|uniref:Uncharacterized protein n=1 Tax=Theobroma cacao TaxID=3641 RepID=A0A061FV60_THECC|nr:Uncharacterized protein TCM_012493 [Theobroma cacao]